MTGHGVPLPDLATTRARDNARRVPVAAAGMAVVSGILLVQHLLAPGVPRGSAEDGAYVRLYVGMAALSALLAPLLAFLHRRGSRGFGPLVHAYALAAVAWAVMVNLLDYGIANDMSAFSVAGMAAAVCVRTSLAGYLLLAGGPAALFLGGLAAWFPGLAGFQAVFSIVLYAAIAVALGTWVERTQRERDRLLAETLAQAAALRASEERLLQEQKLAAIGTMASGVAHEINNPLTGIINLAQLTADRLPADEPAAGWAREIIAEGERIAGTVRELSAFSRRTEPARETVDPGTLADGVHALTRNRFRGDGITVDVDVAPGLPDIACAPQRVQQVLLNLLVNARDAVNECWPGFHPDKHVRLACRRLDDGEGAWVRFTVADRAMGMLPEVAARVFDPFSTTKPRNEATGLGLSISYGIAREHGGRLSVETAPGEGAKFHLDLPLP